ncbi:hypothetical protein ATE68_23495 [Sphingopyxis sp. H038]|nr:hypothetical protein ATE78_23440 [Sphingopyxis sp. H012]KTE29525.1 hypothetical protein ATE68_23495 [Sphingopyxis sp. H038]
MQAYGIDATTGLAFAQMTAPAGATVISPLSTLIDAHGNQNSVRNALGLSTGAAALRSDTNLLTFNPVDGRRSSNAMVAEDAARITSVNLQLLALAVVTKDTNGDPIDSTVTLREVSQYLAQLINETGNARLSDKAVVLAALKKSRVAVGWPDAGLDAMATLLVKYLAAMPERLSDDAAVRAWAYAYRFYVLPELKILHRSWPNAALARIEAITQADIEAAAQSFATVVPPAMTAYVGVTDYRELGPEGTTPYRIRMGGCDTQPYAPYCNDWTLFGGSSSQGSITSVESNAPGALSVLLSSDGYVTVSRRGTFTGLTHFTYTGRSPDGLTSTGTVYVRVRDVP